MQENSNVTYYFNDSTILKYLRKVLNEINHNYMDASMRSAFILKRYIEKYGFVDEEVGRKLVLLCLLKDIGCFYHDGEVPMGNNALRAASSYSFIKNCSPLGEAAKPLFFYKSKYLPDASNINHECGLLMSLANQIVIYNYQEYNVDEMKDLIINDKRGIFHPDQVKKMFKLLKEQPDILEKLNNKANLFIYETSKYMSLANYTVEELEGFIDMATFSFEFHNHETLAHTVTTAIIAEELAKLSRLTDGMIAEIKLAALVHDIGKIRVPLSVLCYPGKLEGEMLEEMRNHAKYTREIIDGCFSYKIVNIASHHHEKLDGSGYPLGLKAIDLSLGDKILAVADIASALYCKRSYKASFDDEKIIEILENDAKNGKLESRIVKHLADNFESIMTKAKEEENKVLDKYNNMKQEYEMLSKSEGIYSLFDYEDDSVDIFND
ncbi:MAG: HD domain-containing protein [Acholeplasmatales bacterium]|nr:HD domain-containing protein [Acholeplasmatales bacterium]